VKKIIICLLWILVLSGCSLIREIPRDDQNNTPAPPPIEDTEPSESVEVPEVEDTSLFHEYKEEAQEYLDKMTLEEKIGQMFLVRCPEEEQLDAFMSLKPGGFILFGRDFEGKTKAEVIDNIKSYQEKNNIPMIIGVDEEGGTVVRVSSNPQLADERFKSPQELYELGGFDEIKKDAAKKSALLAELGINLNLGPVADVSTDAADFINQRAYGKSPEETGLYVKTVVGIMKRNNISATLKHFPGYGSNSDTHTGSAYDKRPYSTFEERDFIPFEEGIKAGAESILVSHNVVEAIDPALPASLSNKVIDILRNKMEFTGIIMTDDLSMGAVSELTLEKSTEATAVLAGNDMLIVTDYEKSYNSLLEAVTNKEIPMEKINKSVLRILEWKFYKKIM